ncbi:TPA: glycosyltransferase [Vibrio cholerae]
MKKIKYKVIALNFSNVIGGQEQYLLRLRDKLMLHGITLDIFSQDSSISTVSYFDSSNYDIILLNGNKALYKSMFSFFGRKVIYVHHSDINDSQGPSWKVLVRKVLLKISLCRVDLVIRVCDMALPLEYAKGKIITVYNGVKIPFLTDTFDKNEMFRLLMVGALTKNKNQKLALNALTLLPKATLTIVGDGPERKNLERLTHELGVAERVSFEGFVSDPSRYYQTHDLLLMLSFYEAFPYVVLEAMAAKCPVVSVKVGGVPEAITDGKDGWLLSGYSHTELADRVDAISRDSEAYAAISCAARNTIEKRFTEDHMVEQLLNEISKRSLVK